MKLSVVGDLCILQGVSFPFHTKQEIKQSYLFYSELITNVMANLIQKGRASLSMKPNIPNLLSKYYQKFILLGND